MWKFAALAIALVAAGGCFDNSMFPSTCPTGEGQAVVGMSTNPERFVDNGDGTVTDAKTGLVWEKAPAPVDVPWTEVAHACEPKGTGWRVPTIDELRSLLVGCPATETGGACPISTTCKSVENCADRDACAGCVTADAEAHSSFFDVSFSFCTEQSLSHEVAFWSSTIATSGCESWGMGGCTPYYVNTTTGAVDYGQGVFDFGGPTYEVLCVRDGARVEENPPDCPFALVVFQEGEDGTVTASNGLVWEQQPSICDFLGREPADAYCRGLGESWRLPDIDELRSLVVGCAGTGLCGACPAEPNCATCPSYESDCFCAEARCRGCTYANGRGSDSAYLDDAFSLPGGPALFDGPRCARFWSSSLTDSSETEALAIDFDYGALVPRGSSTALGAWCVRTAE